MWWYASFLVFTQIVVAGSALAQGAVQAERRFALIIGNSAYGPSVGTLPNPVHDAQAMAALQGA